MTDGPIGAAEPCAITNQAQAFAILSGAPGANGSFTLEWESCGNCLYEVQTSDALSTQAFWMTRALMVGGDSSTRWTNAAASDSVHRFYRVQRFSFDGDEDGDGYNNFQEYRLRTKPDAAYSCPADLPRNLVAWWKLDEGMGTNVLDASLNGHDGFALGGHTAGLWTTGVFSNAAMLGGASTNWIQVPYESSLVPTQQFTLMGWVKHFGQGVLIGNWDSGGQMGGNYLVQFGPDYVELRFSPTGDGPNDVLHFDPGWTTNDWHHVAVCYADTNLSVFVDGQLENNCIVTNPLTPARNPVTIGFPGLETACSVDDVRIYNRALPTNEIASLSRGDGLPIAMTVGQTATLHAFGATENADCRWSVLSGKAFFTNAAGCTTDFRPSASGMVTVQMVYASSAGNGTNTARSAVAFPTLSPIAGWNAGNAQQSNNCYNYATDIRTDTFAQPGGSGTPAPLDCVTLANLAGADGLQPGVDLDRLCQTSGLPGGHISALLVWPGVDFHWARQEADGTWSHKPGNLKATTLDNSGLPISDPRTANFGSYVFCGFFWVGPEVHIR